MNTHYFFVLLLSVTLIVDDVSGWLWKKDANKIANNTPLYGIGPLGYPTQPPRPETSVQSPEPGILSHQTPLSGPGSLKNPSKLSIPGTPSSIVNQPNFQNPTSSRLTSIGTASSGSQSPVGSKTSDRFAFTGSKHDSLTSGDNLNKIKSSSSTPAPKQGVLSSVVSQTKINQSTPLPVKSGLPVATAIGAAAGAAQVATSDATAKKFSSDPKFSPGKTVTNEDLEKLSETLFIKDNNNAMKFITLNLQQTTSAVSNVDKALQPLLNVSRDALKISTIRNVLRIHDNYNLDNRIHESINSAKRLEESLLVDTFSSTNVMSFLKKFLVIKRLVKNYDGEFKNLLKKIWFSLYQIDKGQISSSGFEHVFMAEIISGIEVLGFNNWIYFNAKESKKQVDYLGYIKKVNLGDKAAILKFNLKFEGLDKPETTMFIGTSPELEMALYTVCFLVRPNQTCPVSSSGTKFNIITNRINYHGSDFVKSAYPEI